MNSRTWQQQQKRQAILHEVGHAVFHMCRKHMLHMPSCSFQLRWCFARPFLPLPRPSRYSIKSSRDVLENWPVFSQRLEGEGGGKGTWRDSTWARFNLSETRWVAGRGRTERSLRWMARWLISWPCRGSMSAQKQPLQLRLSPWVRNAYYTLRMIGDKTTPSRHI